MDYKKAKYEENKIILLFTSLPVILLVATYLFY